MINLIKKPWITAKQVAMGVVKNFKRLLSSKTSMFLIIFGPLLLIGMMGLAFQGSGLFGIKIGAYSPQKNNITDSILEGMKKSNFIVIDAPKGEDCIQWAKESKVHLCVIFPNDFSTGKMEFYVDYSRLNLVYTLINRLSEQVSGLSTKISLGATEDLLQQMGDTADVLSSNRKVIAELRNNAYTLQGKLQSISRQLDGIEISLDSETFSQVSDPNSDLNSDVDETKQQIREVRGQAIQMKDTVDPKLEDLDVLILNLEEGKAVLQCTSWDDLTNYLFTEEFPSRLGQSEDPACSLLETFRINLQRQKGDLAEISEYLGDFVEKADSMEGKIDSIRRQVRGDVSRTQQDVATVSSQKDKLSAELKSIAVTTNSTIRVLDSLSTGLDNLTGTFESLSLTDASSVIQPIKTSIKGLSARKYSPLELMFPALILVVVMFVSILLSNTLIMQEKMSKAHFRNGILPSPEALLIVSNYITSLIVISLQVGIILAIATLFFKVSIAGNIGHAFVLVAVICVFFSSVGMAIAYVSSSEETSTLSSVLLSVLLLMFSGIIIPLESMAREMAAIATYSPFNLAESFLRSILIYGSNTYLSASAASISFAVELVALVCAVLILHTLMFHKK